MYQDFWAYYVIIGIILMALEILVSGFYLLPIGLGVLISSIFSLFIENRSAMHFVTATLILICLVVVRKYFRKTSNKIGTPTEEMIGKTVTLESDIPKGGRGYGKIFGESWMVLAKDSNLEFSKDEVVVIVGMDGNKLLITKK